MCDILRENPEKQETMEENKKKFEYLSQTDQLTGLYNRHKLHEVFTSEINRSNRFEEIFGIILLDIDLFKNVNDTYGHNIGDLVLKEISNIHSDKIEIEKGSLISGIYFIQIKSDKKLIGTAKLVVE